MFCKLGDVVFAGIVHRNADHLQSLVCVLLPQLLEPRHLDLAGLAPSRPEVQKDGFATEIGEVNSLAVKRFQSEVGRQLPADTQRRWRSRCAVGTPESRDQYRCYRYGSYQDYDR